MTPSSTTLIPPHGGYRDLKSYQMAEIIHDATVVFCDHKDQFSKFREQEEEAPRALPVEGATQAPVIAQMMQAARSGKQNIAKGSIASGTPYQFAFIRTTSLPSWSSPRRIKMYASVASSWSPRSIFESEPLSSKKRLRLVGVARASLEELLVDFQDFLRQKALPLWGKDHAKATDISALAYRPNRSYTTYRTYFEEPEPEVAANAAICLIHQANYLLDQQLRALEKGFLEEGGFTERLYGVRSEARNEKKQ